MSAIRMLSIEIDGHFHGSPDVPKPWVAKIVGPCQKYGLQREFVQNLNDWKDASVAWSGNIYGRVARFPLRDGHLYEVSRLRGKSSRRHVAREFLVLEGGCQKKIDPSEALARVIGPGVEFRIREDKEYPPAVARVEGLGTPSRQGFVVTGNDRLYLLRDGLYEVRQNESQHFMLADVNDVRSLSEKEALEWLSGNQSH